MKLKFDKNYFSMKFLYKSYIFVLIFSISFVAKSQQSAIYTTDLKDYNQAITLFQSQQFQSAKNLFEKVKQSKVNDETKSDCYFFIASCTISQDKTVAITLFENFVKNYPTSIKTNEAFSELGNLYFETMQYQQALEWLERVDERNIVSQTDRFYFQKGFSFYKNNNKKDAAKNFNKVLNSEIYGSQAKYYLGFMAYENDNYKEANFQFNQIQNEDKFKEKMSYYQADMNFKQGNFQQAIDLGTLALLKSNENEKSELNKIIGESHFNLNQYEKSIPFLENYKGKKGKWSNTDYYILGYAFYKKNDFEKAIFHFNKIINGNDVVAQNAYYHLGESYLKTDKKQQALNAFKSASEMNYDMKIQEDAAFNYAKLSYEIGNSYQSIPSVLTDFQVKYPENPNKNYIETLLIDSFISSKDYKNALITLEKNKNNPNRIALQKVTFYLGLENFTDGKYNEALGLFKKSIAVPENPQFVARTIFWQGETEFVLDNFAAAIISFKQFLSDKEAVSTPEFQNVNYNLAYSYFKIKEYATALGYFQSYILVSKNDNFRLADALVRLADCNFVNSKYWPAIESYKKAIDLKSTNADYAAFQTAMSYGFLSRNDRKIEDLISFLKNHPKSQYYDDALYELANTYVSQNKNENAIATFDKLIAEFPQGIFESKSILKQGLIYFNSDKNELALTKLKKVTTDFPNSPEALEAVSTAKLIYIEEGKVAEYVAWVKTLKYVQINDLELENDTYDAADKYFLQNDTKQAVTGFTGYLANFPNGIHATKANFYLGQLYFSENLENNAIPKYEYVITQPRNTFSEQALVRLSQIYLNQKMADKAILVLTRLEKEADFPQNITFAQANLMKLYFEKSDYTNSVLAAEKVLNNSKSDEKVKNDAQIIIARAAFKTSDFNKAKLAYNKLLLTANGELGAEALYYDAYFKNLDKKYELSNIAIQKLTKNYSSYQYFGAKGLVIMAKNFYGIKDAFQANYILESVIKNFSQFNDVIEEAKLEQDLIQKEEAKTNSSLQK